ncbi:hypothetical protein C8F01DRAFT_1080859 [Mycena amicta]|nr:hypothetical protein C8F01DRAFT_1080859 [Mycena amicta]
MTPPVLPSIGESVDDGLPLGSSHSFKFAVEAAGGPCRRRIFAGQWPELLDLATATRTRQLPSSLKMRFPSGNHIDEGRLIESVALASSSLASFKFGEAEAEAEKYPPVALVTAWQLRLRVHWHWQSQATLNRSSLRFRVIILGSPEEQMDLARGWACCPLHVERPRVQGVVKRIGKQQHSESKVGASFVFVGFGIWESGIGNFLRERPASPGN